MLCTGTISAGGGKTGISYLFKNIWTVFKYKKTWIKAISKVIDGLCLGQPFIMTTGAKFLPKQSITAIVIQFALLRSLLSSFCSLFYQSIIGMMVHKTKTDAQHTEMFQLPYEFLAFFITIPQGLGYLTVPQVWNMIYFSFYITVLLMNIVSRIAAIGSMITDVHSFILKYSKYLLAIYCMVSLIVGMLSIGEKHYLEACYFISYIICLLELFNVTYLSIMIYCVYGVTKLSDDIQFLTGSPPTKFWKLSWYILPFVLVYAFYEEFSNHVQVKREKVGIHYLINIIAILCMIPIPICWIIEVINHLRSRYLIGMFRSTDSWGPADPEERHKRLSFNPRLQTKYQSRSSTCNHHCFISYRGLQILQHEETRCREAFLNEFNSSGLPKKGERKGSIKRSVALDVLDHSK
ncbi:sodium- and chloride-dependent glycine transporter 2-like isoform X2 [Onthophagus taurus]